MAGVDRGPTLGEQVYRLIRERIVLGELRPGEILVESDLAGEFAVSRTPVSNAVIMLKERGLLEDQAGRPAVPKLTVKDVIDLYRCRFALDGLAARLACENVTREEIERLERDVRIWEEPASEEHRKALWVADLSFHETIYQASGNRHLMRFAQISIELAAIYRRRTIRRLKSSGKPTGAGRTQSDIRAEHGEILDALKLRDPDLAESAAHAHIANVIEHLQSSDVSIGEST